MGYMIDGVEYSDTEMKTLEKARLLQLGRKNDPASTTLTATPLHGAAHGNANQFGVFSGAGVRPDRFSAMPRIGGLSAVLPLRPSTNANEMLEIMTGQTAATGSNATGWCGNPPTPGNLKVMRQVFTFGDIHIKMDLAALPLIGQVRDRADVPGQVYNQATVDNAFLPQIPGIDGLSNSMSMLRSQAYRIGVQLERTVSAVHYTGVAGVQNNTHLGIQTQWAGLDALIKTGYTDSVTGIAAPAADSVVSSFNANITGTDSVGFDFVENMHDVYYALRSRAENTGMGGTVFAISMREELFRRATDVWGCAYATYRCKNTSDIGNDINRDATQTRALQIQMFKGQYLLFDGVEVPVIFDGGIPNPAVANATYQSDVYFLPISWSGMPLVYPQYFPMDNPALTEFASFTGAGDVRTLNNGLYLVAKRHTPNCVEYIFSARVRLILEAPFLAGRVDDVQYTYRAQTRSNQPGESFFANGGVTYRT